MLIVSNFLKDLKYRREVGDTDWDKMNFDTKWNAFKTTFIEVSNKHAPIQTRRLKTRNNPWVIKEIVQLMYQQLLKRKRCKM